MNTGLSIILIGLNIIMNNVFISAPRHGKVSAKIQQLLNTLKRPKRKPLQEFFQESDDDLEGINFTSLSFATCIDYCMHLFVKIFGFCTQ